MTFDHRRAHVHYSGQVQGVGFRWRACRVAEEFAVTGWVRNLSDGRVELVAEGPAAVVEDFLATVAQRLDRHIEQQAIDRSEGTGAFRTFDVRR